QPEGSEIRMAAIWSLSKIGGEKVRDTLEKALDDSEDDDEIEMLEDALENLQFTEGFNQFGLIDYEPENEEKIIAQTEADAWDDDSDETENAENDVEEEDE
ncbi:MAG: HEAT repeat domain-containing protein, partial [Bellilinea sp.]